jgi:membrane fusion protein (multidrug efflux system)
MPVQSQTEPSDHNGRKPSSTRKRRVIGVFGVILLLLVIAAGVVYYWHWRFYESTDDASIQGHPINVSARASGNIVHIFVADNQHVPKGELLVAVDPCDYQIRLAGAEAALQAAQADEQKASADREASKAQWTQQEQDLRRSEELAKQGVVTAQVLEHSRTSAVAAQANLNAAERSLASARAKTAQADAAVDEARLQLSYTQIRAPEAGYVTQKSVEVGTYVNVGQPLMAIVTDVMYVIANFKETQLTHMRPGQPATVAVDAYPGVVFQAHVESIQAGTGPTFSLFPPENATGNFVKIVQRVPVKIVFDGPPDPNRRLVLGMSVRPKVRVRDMDK